MKIPAAILQAGRIVGEAVSFPAKQFPAGLFHPPDWEGNTFPYNRRIALCALLFFAALPLARAQDGVDAIYLRAQREQQAGHYEDAIRSWTAALKINPKDATAYYNRAVAHGDNAEPELALADYGKAIECDPADPQAYEARAKIYSDRAMEANGNSGGDTATDKPDWDKAIADCRAAITLRMKGEADPKGWLEQKEKDGTKYALDAACDDALIQLDPKDSGAWFRRARIDPFVANQAGQMADLNEAIRLDPDNADARLARAHLRGESPEEKAAAAADFGEAIRIDPVKHVYFYTGRAALYVDLKQYDKALADYDRAIKLGAGYGGYLGRADVYECTKQWDKAEADYTSAIGQSSPGYIQRAEFYHRRQQWDKALADVSKAIAIDIAANKKEESTADGSVPDEWIMRGDLWVRKGMYDKALADFRSAFAADGQDWLGNAAVAWLLATCPDAKYRDGAAALKLAMKACLGTGWVNATALDTLAAAEAETGHWDDAIKHEKMAIDTAAEKNDDKDAREETAAEIKQEIAGYTARLAQYGEKQPCREVREMGNWNNE